MARLAIALAAVAWTAAYAAQNGGKAPVAVVVDSGSTNTEGFRLEVDRSGKVRYTPAGRHGAAQPAAHSTARQVPAALARRLYADLESAKALASLPEGGPCMKSASFGSTLTVEYGGQTTPDLSCPGDDPHMQALARDAKEIAAAYRQPKRRVE